MLLHTGQRNQRPISLLSMEGRNEKDGRHAGNRKWIRLRKRCRVFWLAVNVLIGRYGLRFASPRQLQVRQPDQTWHSSFASENQTHEEGAASAAVLRGNSYPWSCACAFSRAQRRCGGRSRIFTTHRQISRLLQSELPYRADALVGC